MRDAELFVTFNDGNVATAVVLKVGGDNVRFDRPATVSVDRFLKEFPPGECITAVTERGAQWRQYKQTVMQYVAILFEIIGEALHRTFGGIARLLRGVALLLRGVAYWVTCGFVLFGILGLIVFGCKYFWSLL
jgi:hypothetical protein